MAAFVFVNVGYIFNNDILICSKAFDLLTKNLFYTRNPEKEEWICTLTDVKKIETENEVELVLFVVSDETDEGILAFINDVLIF